MYLYKPMDVFSMDVFFNCDMTLRSTPNKREEIYNKYLQEISGIKFTFREIDVIASLVHNRNYTGIAELLSIPSTRTVQTHIRNIKNKLDRDNNSGEYRAYKIATQHIINEVESSGKLQYFRQYYFHIRVQLFFERTLQKIYALINRAAITCLTDFEVFEEEKKLLEQITKHLALANINLVKNKNKTDRVKYYLYTISNSTFGKINQNSRICDTNIALVLDKNANLSVMTNLKYIDFTDEYDYYFNILKLIEKIIDKQEAIKIIEEFKIEYQKLQNSWEGTFKHIALPEKNKLITWSGFNSKQYLYIFILVFMTLAFFVFFVQRPHLPTETLYPEKKHLFSSNEDNKLNSGKLANKLQIAQENKPYQHISSYLKEEKIRDFISRKKELALIDDIFEKQQHVILTGFSGVGKSSIALEYGYRLKSKGAIVRWLDCNSEDKIYASYIRIAKELQINTNGLNRDVLISLVNSKFESIGITRLFIFDNVNNYEDVKKYLLQIPANIKILITTTNANLMSQFIRPNQYIKLASFTTQEARLYLHKSLDKRIKIHDIDRIISTIGTIPRKLSQTVSFFQNNHLESVDSYFRARSAYMGDSNQTEANMLFDLPVDQGKESLPWRFLQIMCYLDPDFSSVEIFKKLLKVDNTQLQKILDYLISLSLIDMSYRDNSIGITTHRETQIEIIRYRELFPQLSIDEKDIYDSLFKALDDLMPFVTFNPDETWITASILKDSIQTALLNAQNSNISNDLLGKLSLKLGAYYEYIACNFDMSIKYKKLSLKIRQDLYKGNNIKVAKTLSYIGRAYYQQGTKENVLKGLEFCQKALKMKQALYKVDHPEIALSLDNTGCAYVRLGGINNIQKGLEYKLSSLEMRRRLYKDNNFDIVLSLNNIGWALQRIGDRASFVEAIQYQKQALTMMNELFPDKNHPHFAYILYNIGVSYARLGGIENLRKALEYSEMSLRMRRILYRNNYNISLALSFKIVGEIYAGLGDSKKGVEYTKQAYLISKNAKGVDNAVSNELRNTIKLSDPYFIASGEERFPILTQGTFDKNVFRIKEKLQKNTIDIVQKYASHGVWNKNYLFGKYGIKPKTEKNYLDKELGELSSKENIDIAKMLIFEAINIGILSKPNNLKNYDSLIKFIEENPAIIQKVADKHPEYFIDELILNCCIENIESIDVKEKLLSLLTY